VQFTGGKAVPVTTVPVTKNEWVYKGEYPDDVIDSFERADALRRLNRLTGAGAVRGGGFVPEGKSVPANTLGEAVRGKTYHMIGDSEEDDEDSWVPLKARREAAKAKYIERAKKHNVRGKASPQQDLDTIAMVAEYRGKAKGTGDKDVTDARLSEALHATGFRAEVGKLGSSSGKYASDVLAKVRGDQRLNGSMGGKEVRVSTPLLYSDFARRLSKQERGTMLAMLKDEKLRLYEDNDGFIHVRPIGALPPTRTAPRSDDAKFRRMDELQLVLAKRLRQITVLGHYVGKAEDRDKTVKALEKKIAALSKGKDRIRRRFNAIEKTPVAAVTKKDTRLPFVQLEESRKRADDDLRGMSDTELRTEYEKASVQSGGAFASAGVRRDAAGDELIRRGITQYKVPWSELPMKVHGSGQKDTKFDEVAHAKGVLAAKSLAGSGAVGPSPKHVKEAEKTLKKSGLMPSTYVIPDKHELSPVTRVYKTHKPVLGDIFLQGESRAEVIKIYKTARGNTAIDINVIGKKKGRIHTVYLEDAPEEIGVKPATLPKREYLTAKQIGERVDQLKSAPGVVDANERSRLKVLSNMVALNESKKKNSMPKSVKPSMNTVEPSAYRPAPKPKSAPTKTKTKPKSSKATNAAPMLTAYLKKIGVPGKVEAHKYPKGASAQFSYEVTLKKRDKKVESQIDKFYDKEKSTPRDGVLRFKESDKL
jgi:hypothetical protein